MEKKSGRREEEEELQRTDNQKQEDISAIGQNMLFYTQKSKD